MEIAAHLDRQRHNSQNAHLCTTVQIEPLSHTQLCNYTVEESITDSMNEIYETSAIAGAILFQ